MLQFGNKEFRNLQEQVLKNMQDIANIEEGTAVLSEFGIKVVGEVDALADLPTVNEYKAAHADWEYGDAFAIGTVPPYTLVILTRANDDIETDHWFDIGDFPAPGPQGPAGPMGETGPQGPTGNTGPAGADAGFGSVLATAQTLPAGSAATATVQVAGPNTAKEFSFTFGIPRGADGSTPVWGNIIGTMSDQTDLKNALDAKQDDLVSGTNIKTINNQSLLGSGNVEINSGVWGNITGTLSNQTDLKDALDTKANSADLATVATSGDYDDLIDKPTIGSGIITVKQNGTTIDTFNVNQTANQNLNISTPTKTSDLTNDSGFITGIAWGNITGTLNSQTDLKNAFDAKQDVISDLATIRSGAEAGATAYQLPANGIPETDLNSSINASLDLADSAYQLPNSGVPKSDLSASVQASLDLANSAYQKPVNGIPSTDMTSAVQTSLGLADTAVQPEAGKGLFSGSYNDLTDKPTIGDATLTIKKNGTAVDTFTANATTNKTINITVPTNNNELTNGAGYITNTVNDLVNYTKTSDLSTITVSTLIDDTAPIAGTISIDGTDYRIQAGNPTGYASTVNNLTATSATLPSDLMTLIRTNPERYAFTKARTNLYCYRGQTSTYLYYYALTSPVAIESLRITKSSGVYLFGTEQIAASRYGLNYLVVTNGGTITGDTLTDILAHPEEYILQDSDATRPSYYIFTQSGTTNMRWTCVNGNKLMYIVLNKNTGVTTYYNSGDSITAVMQNRTINGKALSSNITLTASDLNLATVATSGSYNDLLNTPTIPDIYYKDGDIYKNKSYINQTGYLTTGGKAIQVMIPTPKWLTNIKSITVNHMNCTFRGVAGYVNGSNYIDYATDSGVTVTATPTEDNMITIVITSTTAYTGGTNNTPINVVWPANGLDLTLHTSAL